MSHSSITVQPLTPVIGAEVEGVDLDQRLSKATCEEIHKALLRHQVLFFRNQDITPERHLTFSRHFGEPQATPFVPSVEGYPEIALLENDRGRPPNRNQWHSDISFTEQPALGAVLLMREGPEVGGDTMWSNMYAAYEALSDRMQQFLSGLIAIHDHAHIKFTGHRTDEDRQKGRSEIQPAEHPVVRTHPDTERKGLFVNETYTIGIKGMEAEEARALLSMLFSHVARPEFTCRFRWRRHSVAFWDNRCTQHYALADYWPHHRLMQRVTLRGDRPY